VRRVIRPVTPRLNVTVSNTAPTRAGYTFTGWDAAADGSGTDYAGGATVHIAELGH
jgi:hypothetical protein